MRVMVVKQAVYVELLVSARRKRYISEKFSKMRVSRFPKSGPSVKIRFGFRGFLKDIWSEVKDKMIITIGKSVWRQYIRLEQQQVQFCVQRSIKHLNDKISKPLLCFRIFQICSSITKCRCTLVERLCPKFQKIMYAAYQIL